MAHCAQCGSVVPPGASVCPSCSLPCPGASVAQRTMLGTASSPAAPSSSVAGPTSVGGPESGSKKVAQTIVGMPVSALPQLAAAAESAKGASNPATTLLGMPASAAGGSVVDPNKTNQLGSNARLPGAAGGSPEALEAPSPAQRTLLGVARPGIAPLDPMANKALPPPEIRHVSPAEELGATIGARLERGHPDGVLGKRIVGFDRAEVKAAARRALGKERPLAGGKRALAVVVAAGLLAVGAVLFAIFWRSAPPLAARATVDAEGNEVLEVTCDSCPDGTLVKLGGGEGEVSDHKAIVRALEPLSVGDNQMDVLIDRPGSGRDEEVHLAVQVSYRVRPDLTPLQGQSPALQVVVEAIDGTEVEIDGRDVPLVAGRAVYTLEVADALAGAVPKNAALERRVSYNVRPPEGEPDQGEVAISVGIVPLTLFAPGPSIVIADENFVLAGRTQRDAKITAAGKPIPLKPDGTFAQVMNVSSVGQTQIEVRASLPSKAPRLMKIDVRRVDDLGAAASEFERRGDLVGYAALRDDIDGHVGRSIAIRGDIAEARRENHQTVALIDVSRASGCGEAASSCQVRLTAGFDSALSSGDSIRAFGRVSGAFEISGRRAVPEVDVEFIVKEGR